MRLRFVAAMLLVGVAFPARAEDDPCGNLIRQGVYDHFREVTTSLKTEDMRKNICDVFNQYKRDVAAGNVQASYALFNGSASASKESIEALGHTMCESVESAKRADEASQRATDNIHDAALTAYNQCKALLRDGLRVETSFVEYPELGGVGHVDITLSYSAPGITEKPKIQRVAWDTKAFTCTGTLVDLRLPVSFTESKVAMHCDRTVSKTLERALVGPNAKEIYAPTTTIVVDTGADSIVTTVTAIVPPSPPEPTVDPVGSVMAYAGPLDGRPGEPTNWLPCDGRALRRVDYERLYFAIGATYGDGHDPSSKKKVGDFNLPDYRGYFLRGVDDLEENSKRDPDRDSRTDAANNTKPSKAVGSTQPEAVGPHTHPIVARRLLGGGAADWGWKDESSQTTSAAGVATAANDGKETRPKNVYVYWIIRSK